MRCWGSSVVVGGGAVRAAAVDAGGVGAGAVRVGAVGAGLAVLVAFVLVLLHWRRSLLLSPWPIYRIVVVSNHFLCTLVLTCWAHAPALQLGIDI